MKVPTKIISRLADYNIIKTITYICHRPNAVTHHIAVHHVMFHKKMIALTKDALNDNCPSCLIIWSILFEMTGIWNLNKYSLFVFPPQELGRWACPKLFQVRFLLHKVANPLIRKIRCFTLCSDLQIASNFGHFWNPCW